MLVDLEKEIFELRMKSFGFESGDFAAKSAQQTLEIELQKLTLAKEEANLKFAVIEAEFNLLSAKRVEQKALNDRDIADLKKAQQQRQEDIVANNALQISLDERRGKAEILRMNESPLTEQEGQFLARFNRDEMKFAGESARLE